jgi:hypothetical protein
MISLRSEVPARAKMLWAAVLRRAVFDYALYKGVGKHKLMWQRAYQFIFIPEQEYENGLSFEQVCELFDWDPEYLRRMTAQLTRDDVKRMETSSFRDEFTQEVVESFVKNSGRWKTANFAIPLYPRMVDDFVPVPAVRIVRRPPQSKPPMIQWEVSV